MSNSYLIGIDCGSTMIKAALLDCDGREIGVAGRKIDIVHPMPGWTENNMNALWDNVCAVVSEVLKTSAINPHDVACVTCTGHGNGLFLADANGNPVRAGIGSSDSRARRYIEQWTSDNVLDKLRPKTMQAIWAAQPNALLRWLIDNEPETIKRTTYLFMVKDYIRFRLTGEAYMELSDMSATSLIDVGTGEYDDSILDAWGLLDTKRIMPPLRRSHDICGKITADAAKRTGLCEGTPVAGGMFDIDACGLAVGMTDETRFCVVAGTWGNNQYISKTPVISPNVFMTTRYSIDGYYLMLEGSATSAGNIDWFMNQFYIGEQDGKQSDDTNKLFSQLEAEILATKPEENGILFLPFLYGGPVDLDAKGTLIGLEIRHTRGDMMRAVLEGIVFGHRWHAQRLFSFRDKPSTIRLTGGGRKSEHWSRLFADVFQIPVEIPHGTELGCLGAAICGAVAVGIYDSYEQACNKMVVIDKTYQPRPELGDIYERKFNRYMELLETLQPAWGKLFGG
jgi:L-xylulokinase